MSTRPAYNRTASNLSIDLEGSSNNEEHHLADEGIHKLPSKKNRASAPQMSAEEFSKRNSSHKASRRESRIPRSLVESLGNQKILVTIAVGDADLETYAGSRHIRSSATATIATATPKATSGRSPMRGEARRTVSSRSPMRQRRQQHNSYQRSASNRSLQGGSSARGGEKESRVVTEDDNWAMFKEALQSMA